MRIPKLTILAALTFAATVSIARAERSDNVRVSEKCDKQDCFITIRSESRSPCIAWAKGREWSAGYQAAVAIRNCMDKEAGRGK